MFCPKCGKELPDGVAVCDACGATIETVEETTAPAASEEVNENAQEVVAENETEILEESTPSTEAAGEESAFADPSFEKPAKKGKKGLIIGISAGVLAVAAALLIIFNFSFLQGFFIKTFGSDEAYFKFVEYKAFSEHADSLSSVYGNFSESMGKEATVNTNLSVEVSDEVMALLKDQIGDIDIDWAKDINLDMNTVVDGSKEKLELKLNLGDNTILDLDGIIDMENLDLYFALENLSDKYVMVDGDAEAVSEGLSNVAVSSELTEALPTEDEFNELLKKYLKLAINSLENVDESTETIEIDGIEQKVTVLEFELTEENTMKMVKEVLKELKKDEDVKAYIKDIEKFAEDEINGGEDLGDLYGEFKDIIDEAIDAIDEGEYNDDDPILVLTDYVNGKHEIIGRKLEIGSQEIFYYATVRDGKDFAFEAIIENVKLEGKGNDKKDMLNAEFELIVDEKSLVEIKITDFDCKKWEDGILDGNIKIIPSEDLMGLVLGNTESAVASLLEPALEFDFEGEENSGKFSMNLLSKDKVYVGITISTSVKEEGKVKVPSDDDIISADNVDEWLEDIDLGKLTSALEKAGLPEELLNALDLLLSSANAMTDQDAFGFDDDAYFSDSIDEDALGEYVSDEYLDDYYDDLGDIYF